MMHCSDPIPSAISSCIPGSNPDNAHWHKAQICSHVHLLAEGACTRRAACGTRHYRERKEEKMEKASGNKETKMDLFVCMDGKPETQKQMLEYY